jgi:tetratricopeptide (TPR) repeat protein
MDTLSSEELAKLDRFLSAHTEGFVLGLLLVPQLPAQEQLVSWLSDYCRERNRQLRTVRVARMSPSAVWREVEAGAASGGVTAIFDADAALEEPGSELALLLNRQRERIAQLLRGPVLLMLGDHALTRFLVDAPDLADWYAAMFEFEVQPAPVERMGSDIEIPEQSSELIESRISLLRAQLSSDLPDRTRARILRELGQLYRDATFGVQTNPFQSRPRTAIQSFAEADRAFRQSIELWRQAIKTDPSPELRAELAQTLNRLGQLYLELGLFDKADPLFEEGLTLLGEKDPLTAALWNNLGFSFMRQGKYAEAEPLFRRSLGNDTTSRLEDPDRLVWLHNLSALYERQGRLNEAEELLERVLRAKEGVLGNEHPETLMSVNNLGVLRRRQRRYSDAERLLRRALAGREKVLGPMHPVTLLSAGNLGHIYALQARYDEAEALLMRVVRDTETVLGPRHPQTLRAAAQLGYVFRMARQNEQAVAWLQRAWSGEAEVLGPAHPDTVRDLRELAAALADQGGFEEAERLLQRAIEENRQALGPEHSQTRGLIEQLESLRSSQHH